MYWICSRLRTVESPACRAKVQAPSQRFYGAFRALWGCCLSLYATTVGFLVDQSGSRVICSSDKDDRLRARDLKAPAAPCIPACQHIVDPDQVISRLLKTCSVLFICAARQLRFLRPLQPAHIVFGAFATVRTAIRRLFNFFFLVKEIAFVHDSAPQLSHSSRRYLKL